MKLSQKKKTHILIASIILFTIIIVFTAFGKRGFFTLLKLRERRHEIAADVKKLEQENELLKEELLKLERRDYREYVVRSQMGMAKQGETIYIFTTE
jgi:cell division protein FtsB